MASTAPEVPSFRVSPFREVASGLNYPEGPVYRPDGSVLVVEIGAGCLSRIAPDGTKSIMAQLGGGPNGAAIGPDGAVYVCNDGGFQIVPVDGAVYVFNDGGFHIVPANGIQVALGQPANYSGGKIQRVAADGTFTTLYTSFPVPLPAGQTANRLCSPDDLVFDSTGHFWFTDWGKTRLRDRDVTGVYYAAPDGSSIAEKIFPLQSPNGIGLSPDEGRLYVAESYTRRILYWELSAPGTIRPNPRTIDGSYILTAKIPYAANLDSLALDEEGNIYVASFLPQGNDPTARGGITVVSPGGEILEWIEIDIGQADPLPSNLCFGGPDRRTMYVTLSGTGRLIACDARVAGKKLAFGDV